MAKLEVLNPLSKAELTRSPLAPRLPDLSNKRIGLFWNGKGGGDVALRTIGDQLEKRFPGAKAELIHGHQHAAKDVMDKAKSFDAVVGGVAD